MKLQCNTLSGTGDGKVTFAVYQDCIIYRETFVIFAQISLPKTNKSLSIVIYKVTGIRILGNSKV